MASEVEAAAAILPVAGEVAIAAAAARLLEAEATAVAAHFLEAGAAAVAAGHRQAAAVARLLAAEAAGGAERTLNVATLLHRSPQLVQLPPSVAVSLQCQLHLVELAQRQPVGDGNVCDARCGELLVQAALLVWVDGAGRLVQHSEPRRVIQ